MGYKLEEEGKAKKYFCIWMWLKFKNLKKKKEKEKMKVISKGTELLKG